MKFLILEKLTEGQLVLWIRSLNFQFNKRDFYRKRKVKLRIYRMK
jgi:hypothetical protein